MKSLSTMTRHTLLAVTVAGLLYGTPAMAGILARDVVTVATVSSSQQLVDVPIYISDASGTTLGIDQPPGSRIQSYSIKVDYAPTSAVQSVTFTRAGITAPLTPTFESTPSSAGSVSLLDTFNEGTNLIPFVSNAPAPGNLVGHLTVTLAPGLPVGTTIPFTIDPVLTQLTDAGGNAVTAETAGNARLTLVSGAIVVSAQVPTLDQWALVLLGLSLAAFAVYKRI